MLNFILGPSGSGKSYQMLAELRTRAERGERSILIVPEQFTSSTEGVLYRTLGDSLSAYVESYSFTSLSEALLRRYGGAAVPTLTEAGRALLLRRAADSLLDKVVYYSRQRRSAAFCEKAAQTISELKSAGVTPEMLADYAKTPGADREKLDELALIYNAYEGLLAQSAMDPGDRQQRAAERLDAEFFAGRAVFIDEFDTFNAPKRALLAAMLPVTDVTVCLCCDGEQDADGQQHDRAAARAPGEYGFAQKDAHAGDGGQQREQRRSRDAPLRQSVPPYSTGQPCSARAAERTDRTRQCGGVHALSVRREVQQLAQRQEREQRRTPAREHSLTHCRRLRSRRLKSRTAALHRILPFRPALSVRNRPRAVRAGWPCRLRAAHRPRDRAAYPAERPPARSGRANR